MARKRRDSHTPPVPTGDMVAQVRPRKGPRRGPRTCFRADGKPKKRWPNERQARNYLLSIIGKRWRRAEDPNKHFNIYECPTCGDWHVGHETGWF